MYKAYKNHPKIYFKVWIKLEIIKELKIIIISCRLQIVLIKTKVMRCSKVFLIISQKWCWSRCKQFKLYNLSKVILVYLLIQIYQS